MLHLPLLDIHEGSKVEHRDLCLRGVVLEVFTPKAPRGSKCPLRLRYKVRWKNKSKGWYFRKDLRPS